MATLRLEHALAETECHDGEALTCCYLPDQSCVLTGGWDGNLLVWDSAQGICLEKIPLSQKPISACTCSPDGKYWYAGTMDGMLITWDAQNHCQKSKFLAHTRPISSLVFAPDGSRLASVSWDRSVVLWDLEDSEEGKTLGIQGDIVAGCAFAPDSKYLVSWSYDGNAVLWHLPRHAPALLLEGNEDRLTAGAISHDSQWFLSGARDCVVKLWELQYGQPVNSIPLSSEIRGCYFLRDGETALVIDANARMTLIGIPDMQILDELDLCRSVQNSCIAPSGSQVVLACTDGMANFVSIVGFDSSPLVVTATQTVEMKANMFERLLGRKHATYQFSCVCPACRTHFAVPPEQRNEIHHCPQCQRSVKISIVTEESMAL